MEFPSTVLRARGTSSWMASIAIRCILLLLPYLQYAASIQSLTRQEAVGPDLSKLKHGPDITPFGMPKARLPPPEKTILNFTEPGMCFPHPMKDAFEENWEQIQRNVQQGRQKAKSMKVIFAGLIRSAAESAYRSYAMLKNIGQHFKDYHFLVFENDSVDSTVDMMKRITRKDSRYEFETEVLSMGDERGLQAARMERMAILRNKVRDWIEAFVRKSPDWDLVVMYDFDINLAGPNTISPHAFFNSLGRQESLNDDWDMMCANGIRKFCDTAFKGCTPHFHDAFAFRYVHNNSWSYATSGLFFKQYNLFPVDSCFGGLAMYKVDKFLECRYDPQVNDCEHVQLHKCMRERGSQGRMFMDPLLTASYDMFVDLECVAEKDRVESSGEQ